jgi:hypothetical protein
LAGHAPADRQCKAGSVKLDFAEAVIEYPVVVQMYAGSAKSKVPTSKVPTGYDTPVLALELVTGRFGATWRT